MDIHFSSTAPSIPDIDAPAFAEKAVSNNQDVHVSNMVAFDWIRAILKRLPISDRPNTRWFIESREVHFDDSLRSVDAWCELTDVHEKAKEILLIP